jgi:molybdopterin-biosynthesis enzyme MoeA-like protein
VALGLIVAGDYALATGADRHVAFAATLLARSAQALSWAWFVPADRVQIAAALHEAWQRSLPVACFGGLGDGVDDHTRATIEALQQGRDEAGLPRYAVDSDAVVMQVGNVAFFPGDPMRAHEVFARWWQSFLAAREPEAGALASEQVRWALPETAASAQARQQTKIKHPTVSQRLIATAEGGVALRLSGVSKGKVQAARKALQAALKVL